MRILTLGDVFGTPGTEYIAANLAKFKIAEKIDFTVVNGENSAAGNGIDAKSSSALLNAGADVLTGGNHSFKWHSFHDTLSQSSAILRPHNYPSSAPGRGYTVVRARNGLRVLVMSFVGQLYMEPADNPFISCDRLLDSIKGTYDISICDFHAEATSEKAAFARYFDGRINIIVGTHTHVQTCDEQLLPQGSAFITDLGMCGPDESIIGLNPDKVIRTFLTRIRDKSETAEGKVTAHGAVFVVDEGSGYVTGVKRIKF